MSFRQRSDYAILSENRSDEFMLKGYGSVESVRVRGKHRVYSYLLKPLSRRTDRDD